MGGKSLWMEKEPHQRLLFMSSRSHQASLRFIEGVVKWVKEAVFKGDERFEIIISSEDSRARLKKAYDAGYRAGKSGSSMVVIDEPI